MFTPDRQQSKTLKLSMNVDQKSFIRNGVYDWHLKTLFQAIFYPRPSIFKSIFDCPISGVMFKKF